MHWPYTCEDQLLYSDVALLCRPADLLLCTAPKAGKQAKRVLARHRPPCIVHATGRVVRRPATRSETPLWWWSIAVGVVLPVATTTKTGRSGPRSTTAALVAGPGPGPAARPWYTVLSKA